MRPIKPRAWILGCALAATLFAAFSPTASTEHRDSPPVSPAAGHPPAMDAAAAIDDVPVIAIARPVKADPASDPFSTSSWLPPPPPPPPPAAPTPPALPFAYLGRIEDAGKTAVLLGKGDDSYAVRAGDTVQSVWRVQRIGDAGIDFIYLPLAAPVSLAIDRGTP